MWFLCSTVVQSTRINQFSFIKGFSSLHKIFKAPAQLLLKLQFSSKMYFPVAATNKKNSGCNLSANWAHYLQAKKMCNLDSPTHLTPVPGRTQIMPWKPNAKFKTSYRFNAVFLAISNLEGYVVSLSSVPLPQNFYFTEFILRLNIIKLKEKQLNLPSEFRRQDPIMQFLSEERFIIPFQYTAEINNLNRHISSKGSDRYLCSSNQTR